MTKGPAKFQIDQYKMVGVAHTRYLFNTLIVFKPQKWQSSKVKKKNKRTMMALDRSPELK